MEATMKDDLFDYELCGLVKFTDATTRIVRIEQNLLPTPTASGP